MGGTPTIMAHAPGESETRFGKRYGYLPSDAEDGAAVERTFGAGPGAASCSASERVFERGVAALSKSFMPGITKRGHVNDPLFGDRG
jgi:hypothetical protein